MKVFILKTDIKSKREVSKLLKPMLWQNDFIARWSIDIEDVDRVLKIEMKEDAGEIDIISLVREQGIYCEELAD